MLGGQSLLHQAEALVAFKQQLGIHHTEDDEFGWIAEVGLQSPLPPRWTAHTDTASGYVYYIDHDRQASSWENPLVPFLRRIVEIGRTYLQKPTEGFFEEQKGLLWHQHKHELDCWHGPFTDDEGRQYYVNSTAGVSSWQDPRIDAQYIFELESGLISSLEEVLPPPVPDTPGFGPENDPWRTSDGAEVLTLDGAGGVRPGSSACRTLKGDAARGSSRKRTNFENLALKTAQQECRSTLERMGTAASRILGIQRDEEEAQRLQFSQKVKARQQRVRSKTPGGRPRTGEGFHLPGAVEDPVSPATPARRAPAPLDLTESQDFGRTPQRVLGKVLDERAQRGPPPPPPHAQERSKESGHSPGTAMFSPPASLPSPNTGMRPVLGPEVERLLKRGGQSKEALDASLTLS